MIKRERIIIKKMFSIIIIIKKNQREKNLERLSSSKNTAKREIKSEFKASSTDEKIYEINETKFLSLSYFIKMDCWYSQRQHHLSETIEKERKKICIKNGLYPSNAHFISI